jgi:hypothetical protein
MRAVANAGVFRLAVLTSPPRITTASEINANGMVRTLSLKEERSLRASNANVNLDKAVAGGDPVGAGIVIPAMNCGVCFSLTPRGLS